MIKLHQQVALSAVSTAVGRLWDTLEAHKRELGLGLTRLDCGALVLDTWKQHPGSLEAGRLITELSQGGLCRVSLDLISMGDVCLPQITVVSLAPAAACLDLQMAVPLGCALLSGPIRLFLEPLRFIEGDIPLSAAQGAMVAIVEQTAPISDTLALEISQAAHLSPGQLRIIWVAMGTLTGNTQIAGRAVEDVVLTVGRSLELDPTRIVSVTGKCPVCPVYHGGPDVLLPDDFTHYAAQAFVSWLGSENEDLEALVTSLCFQSASCYGERFGTLLDRANYNFWNIPDITNINKLSRVTLNDLCSGRLVSAGQPEPERLTPFLTVPGVWNYAR